MYKNVQLAVSSNVEPVKKFIDQSKSTIIHFNKDFKEKEEFVRQSSNNLFAIDTEINVENSETGIKISRLIRNEKNEIIESIQKCVDSPLSKQIINFEVEFSMLFDLGIGYIKYIDGCSYYGFIKSDKKEPFLLGIFTDSNGVESVQVDHGLEFNVAAWSKTEKNLPEVMQFLKEYVDKGYLSDSVYELFIKLTFKNDSSTIHNKISNINADYLKGIAIKTMNSNALLDLVTMNIIQFSLCKEDFLIKLINKDGSSTIFPIINLNQLEDLATTVLDYYSKNKKLIYDIQILANKFEFNYHHEACEALFLKYNLPKTAKLYVNSMNNLDEAKLYIKAGSSSELTELKELTFDFSIWSTSGRAGDSFKNLKGFYSMLDQAQRWVGYEMNIGLGNEDSTILFNLLSIKNPTYELGRKIFKN